MCGAGMVRVPVIWQGGIEAVGGWEGWRWDDDDASYLRGGSEAMLG